MEKAKWGILSTAKIARSQVIPGMQKGEWSEVQAIASRDLDKARTAARELGIPKAYGSYEELLADPEIDAIYNPLPNHLHVPWSIQALEAGKHVLCEKPIARTAPEVRGLLEAAEAYPHLHVMEAFMYRFHPQWQHAHDLVREAKIGELRTIQTFFAYFNEDPDDIRNQSEIGGGGMLDIGCYPVSLSRWLFGAEPRRVLAKIEFDERFGIDRQTSAILEFERGTATFTCATQLAPYQRVSIHGTRGWIEIEVPFNPPSDSAVRLIQRTGSETREIHTDPANHYTLQGDRFSQAVLGHSSVPMPIDDAVANMKVIDAVFESAVSDQWVEC